MPIENNPRRASSTALAHLDWLLDQALEQTFPASDDVAIDIERKSHDTEARVLDSRTARRQSEGGPADCTEKLTRFHERSSAYSPRRCEAKYPLRCTLRHLGPHRCCLTYETPLRESVAGSYCRSR